MSAKVHNPFVTYRTQSHSKNDEGNHGSMIKVMALCNVAFLLVRDVQLQPLIDFIFIGNMGEESVSRMRASNKTLITALINHPISVKPIALPTPVCYPQATVMMKIINIMMKEIAAQVRDVTARQVSTTAGNHARVFICEV